MRVKFILSIMLIGVLSACTKPTTSSDIASLYTGYEGESWYKISSTCSAKLCATY